MHIPENMVSGSICPLTAAVGVIGVTSIAILAAKSEEKPSSLKFAAVAALIFAAQMMNFPVLNGTSGHFLGTTLAISLLGIPYGILSVVLILIVQCLVFADGGLLILGANIINIAFVGAIPGIIFKLISDRKKPLSPLQKNIFLFLASWFSVVLASAICALELGISGAVELSKAFPAMVGVHSLIGLFEGVITVVLLSILFAEKVQKSERLSVGIPVTTAALTALLLSPFASSFPDGLEWVMEKFALFPESTAVYFVSPLPDYAVPSISNEIFTTGLAGLIGVTLTFALVFLNGLVLKKHKLKNQ